MYRFVFYESFLMFRGRKGRKVFANDLLILQGSTDNIQLYVSIYIYLFEMDTTQ